MKKKAIVKSDPLSFYLKKCYCSRESIVVIVIPDKEILSKRQQLINSINFLSFSLLCTGNFFAHVYYQPLCTHIGTVPQSTSRKSRCQTVRHALQPCPCICLRCAPMWIIKWSVPSFWASTVINHCVKYWLCTRRQTKDGSQDISWSTCLKTCFSLLQIFSRVRI